MGESNKPYLFVSYAHKDSDTVLPVITALKQHGVRIWYDARIELGGKWDDEIAEHVENCYCMLAFLSKNSTASPNCMDEIRYAKDNIKDILPIYIEKFQLSPGLRMRLNIHQSLFKYNYSSNEEFINVLLDSEIVKACIDKQASDTAAAQQEKSVNKSEIEKLVNSAFTYALGLTTKGRIDYSTGYYEGEIVDGAPHGKGKFFWNNGDSYEGDWVGDSMHGQGCYTWSNGDRYEGEWLNDKRTGKGKLFFANGNRYEGEFLNGNRNGQGIFYWSNGAKYEGEWYEDKMHGFGKYTSASGTYYVGKWVNGQRT